DLSATMLIEGSFDLANPVRFEFVQITNNGAAALLQPHRQIAIIDFHTTCLPIRLQAQIHEKLEGTIRKQGHCPRHLRAGSEPAVGMLQFHFPSPAPRAFRMEPPFSARQYALCTRRSKMLCAT